jgi:hypothetical protein
MKKLLFLFAFLTLAVSIKAQVFDSPYDSTSHYHLRLYNQSARSSAIILNQDKFTIDSVLYSLIVYLDSTQFVIISDTSVSQLGLVLKVSNYASGTSSFVTTATTDTVTIPGMTLADSAKSYFFLTPVGSAITSNDVLAYYFLSGTQIVVIRPASGTSGLKFVWRWQRRY